MIPANRWLAHYLNRMFTGALYLAAMFFVSDLLDDPHHRWLAVIDVAVAAIMLQWAVERTIRHARDDDKRKVKDGEKT